MPLYSHDVPARHLPDPLARLFDIALDLHWAWNHAGDLVWRRLDETLWERTQNPWLMLQHVPFDRLQQLADDPEFVHAVHVLEDSRQRYRAAPPWRPPDVAALPRVAYFSMEFGLHEALPLYAGGLGILAGDYLKTASDLGAPVVGVGILWQQGYFRQVLDAQGRQGELYPFNDPAGLPIRPVVDEDGDVVRVSLDLAGRSVLVRAWQARVGRTVLYLLDSNDPFNTPADRGLTSALYGGTSDVRMLQEMILGIGGWRCLELLGLGIQVCHLNEGHAAFVVIERARQHMTRHGVSFREALWATRAGNIFTTHTAVPAGFDTFAETAHHRASLEEYGHSVGLSWPELLALGRANPEDASEPFNMAWLAVRGCSWINGVSRLHGEVSRQLFAGLFARWPEREVPVDHVTNGVHVPSWDSPWTDALWTRASGKERWRGDVAALTSDILRLADEDLWTARAAERHDLVRYARERLARQLARQGRTEHATAIAGDVLDPHALTLGFARRFASYKRPNLLLTDPARLRRLLSSGERPVQLIVAGKAHPQDEEGKGLIQQWAQFAARADVRTRVVFLDDYDMRLAMELVQGVDVWINTPRRPWEASGTSGMKVLVNGGLNVSTLDGWWAEAFDRECGWAVGDRAPLGGTDTDVRDAAALYAILENEVAPAFYDRDSDGLPRAWIARMRSSMARLAPRFSSVRMLQDYIERAYVPAAAAYEHRTADAGALARTLDRWAGHLEQHWASIRFGDVTTAAHDPGRLTVRAAVYLGRIAPDAVRVEIYADAFDGDAPVAAPMTIVEPIAAAANAFVYGVTLATARPAWHFTPRVVPFHPDARVPVELPFIAWAR